jgi:hypothetical protein
VMAALLMADDISELQAKLEAAEAATREAVIRETAAQEAARQAAAREAATREAAAREAAANPANGEAKADPKLGRKLNKIARRAEEIAADMEQQKTE